MNSNKHVNIDSLCMDKFAFRRKIERSQGNLIEAFQKKKKGMFCSFFSKMVLLPLFYYNDL